MAKKLTAAAARKLVDEINDVGYLEIDLYDIAAELADAKRATRNQIAHVINIAKEINAIRKTIHDEGSQFSVETRSGTAIKAHALYPRLGVCQREFEACMKQYGMTDRYSAELKKVKKAAEDGEEEADAFADFLKS